MIQTKLEKIYGHNDLIIGFLRKAKGQTLRVAVCLHILFEIESTNSIDDEISQITLKAAINFRDAMNFVTKLQLKKIHLTNVPCIFRSFIRELA